MSPLLILATAQAAPEGFAGFLLAAAILGIVVAVAWLLTRPWNHRRGRGCGGSSNAYRATGKDTYVFYDSGSSHGSSKGSSDSSGSDFGGGSSGGGGAGSSWGDCGGSDGGGCDGGGGGD